MKIAIDLDEVVFDYVGPFLEFVNKYMGTNFTRKNLIFYNFDKCGITPPGTEQYWVNLFADLGNLRRLRLMPGAKEAINLLERDGHQIIFITSRHAKYIEDTELSLLEAGLYTPELHFSTKDYTKADIINALSIDVFIDDRPEFINEANNRTGAMTILLSNVDNSTQECKPWRYARSWDEVYEAIKTA